MTSIIDPIARQTGLLIRSLDSTAGIVDVSKTYPTVSVYGGVNSSGTQHKFGSRSINFPGVSGDLIAVPHNAGLAMPGDFTIELFVWCGLTGGSELITKRTSGTTGVGDWMLTKTAFYSIGGYDACASFSLPSEQWVHLAITQIGSTVRSFVDGVLTSTMPSKGYFNNTRSVVIGTSYDYVGSYFNGYMDEIRITAGTGRYSDSFTPPVMRLGSVEGFGDVSLLSPAALVVGSFGGSAAIASRMQSVSSNFGTSASCIQPMQVVTAQFGSFCVAASPRPALLSTAHSSLGENGINAGAPMQVVVASSGHNSLVRNPMQVISIVGSFVGSGNAAIKPPMATLQSTGISTGLITSGGLFAPIQKVIGYGGSVCSVSISGKNTVLASGFSGSISTAEIECPLFQLTASSTAQNHGAALLTAPSCRLVSGAVAYLIAPGFHLTAIGSATVSVSYEAYAVNLNHETKPGPAPIDETTRYTNFPFTHVVRYQNSYFGANSTGLYLLEGTTDDGTPIEWDIRTATTDFGTPQLKTVEMAFFGGRFGPAAEITLFAGETAGDPYVYTTPRGTTAKNYRQTFGRGLKARYYALAAKGTDELVLDSITLNIANLARRI